MDEKMIVSIRPEERSDYPDIEQLLRTSFGGDEEVSLVTGIRDSEYYIPDLTLAAVSDSRIVGYIMFSDITIDMKSGLVPALSLAPMAVLPELQGRGIGTRLIERGLSAAKEYGHRIIIVIGHPDYYSRFGFLPASRFGFEVGIEVPDEAFMVLGLSEGVLEGIGGMVRYSPPFNI
jgi:putative acetyltransferase